MENEEKTICLGRRCFKPPFEGYLPPAYHFIPLERGEKVAGRDYIWKFSCQLNDCLRGNHNSNGYASRLFLARGFSLPQSIGLGDDARWLWQGLPMSLLIGVKFDWIHKKDSWPIDKFESLIPTSVKPSAKLKLLSPLWGKLAIRPSLHLSPSPCLTVKHNWWLGRAGPRLGLTLNIHPFRSEAGSFASWQMRLMWHPSDSIQMRAKEPSQEASERDPALEYRRTFVPSNNSKVDVRASIHLPGGTKSLAQTPRLSLNKLKLTNYLFTEGHRVPPRRPSTYLRAALRVPGPLEVPETVCVIPGHWIDPGGEAGAPGEREFAAQVADAVEGQLRSHGWSVLRPDRDAPRLKWVPYLNWVSRQTLKGVPVLEIHGQGSNADYRGYVLGVLGDKEAPLNKELSHHFGMFPMCWTDLAVPRRGGVLLECFNTDEVVHMAPWHRKWAVSQLASTISGCIQRSRDQIKANKNNEL